MRRLVLVIFFISLVTGCDTLTPYDDGVVEGVYVLPDGTTGTFSTRAKARAFRYSGLGTSDIFQFGTSYQGESTETMPTVTMTQAGLRPRSGTFSPSFALDNPYPSIGASFAIHNVPGLNAEVPTDSTTAAVWYGPEGTVTIEVEGQQIRGTFDLWGHPVGTPDSVRVRVYGTFDTPWLSTED